MPTAETGRSPYSIPPGYLAACVFTVWLALRALRALRR